MRNNETAYFNDALRRYDEGCRRLEEAGKTLVVVGYVQGVSTLICAGCLLYLVFTHSSDAPKPERLRHEDA